jgi:ankyrin repeat protein
MKKVNFLFIILLLSTLYVNAQSNILSAIENGQSKQVLNWLSEGHDVNTPLQYKSETMSLLSLASKLGKAEIADILVKKGANVKARIEFKDALMYAAEGGNKEIVNMLVLAGADFTLENMKGQTAKDLAVNAGHSEVANILDQEMQNKYKAIRLAKANKK